MREIKFRVWDSIKKLMHYAASIEFYIDKWGAYPIGEETEITKYNGILMQYVDLKDKNGKEIYEGDIVKYERNSCKKIFEITYGILKNCGDCFNDSGIGFNFYMTEDEPEFLEIIGNRYENHELINQITE